MRLWAENLGDALDKPPAPMSTIISGGVLPDDCKGVLYGIFKAGKCLSPDTLIAIRGKGILKLKDAKVGDYCVNKGGRRVMSLVTSYVPEALKIRLYNGLEIICSPGHRFEMTNIKGSKIHWSQAKNIVPNRHQLRVMTGTNCFGDTHIPNAYWLGLLLGDGSLANEKLVSFTNKDEELVTAFTAPLASYTVNDKNGCTQIRCYQMRGELDRIYGIPAIRITSGDKAVPDCILQATKDSQIAFLQGLFDTDGSCSPTKYGTVEFSSKSENLIHQVQIMLINLGVPCRLTQKIVKGNVYYRLSVSPMFHSVVGFRLGRKRYTRHSDRPMRQRRRGGDWSKVVEITPTEGGEFIDLQTNGGTLTANSISTHNSTLLRYIGLCCAGGIPLFGDSEFNTREVRVLSIQLEIPEKGYMTKLRESSLSQVEEIKENYFFCSSFWLKLDTAEGLGRFEEEINIIKPELVIVDPLYKCLSGSENSGQDLTILFDIIDRLIEKHHFAFLFSSQARKSVILSKVGKVDFGDEEIRGHTAIPGWVDSIIGLRHAGESPTERVLSFTLRHGDKEAFSKVIVFDKENGLYRLIA